MVSSMGMYKLDSPVAMIGSSCISEEIDNGDDKEIVGDDKKIDGDDKEIDGDDKGGEKKDNGDDKGLLDSSRIMTGQEMVGDDRGQLDSSSSSDQEIIRIESGHGVFSMTNPSDTTIDEGVFALNITTSSATVRGFVISPSSSSFTPSQSGKHSSSNICIQQDGFRSPSPNISISAAPSSSIEVEMKLNLWDKQLLPEAIIQSTLGTSCILCRVALRRQG
jgi:hypothetical protein